MTWPKIWHPIYDRCGWQSCPKRKLWRAFVDGLIDNDEKVASSKKHTQLKTKSAKTIPNLRPKWPKSIPYLWPKRLENPTLWDRTYLYSPYKGVPPPPGVSLHTTDTSQVAHQSGAYISGSVAWSDQEYFYSLLDGMLVHRKVKVIRLVHVEYIRLQTFSHVREESTIHLWYLEIQRCELYNWSVQVRTVRVLEF